jgi:hypothetical protein
MPGSDLISNAFVALLKSSILLRSICWTGTHWVCQIGCGRVHDMTIHFFQAISLSKRSQLASRIHICSRFYAKLVAVDNKYTVVADVKLGPSPRKSPSSKYYHLPVSSSLPTFPSLTDTITVMPGWSQLNSPHLAQRSPHSSRVLSLNICNPSYAIQYTVY